eukprot:9136065-Pyramimonas_sp.AAC.1
MVSSSFYIHPRAVEKKINNDSWRACAVHTTAEENGGTLRRRDLLTFRHVPGIAAIAMGCASSTTAATASPRCPPVDVNASLLRVRALKEYELFENAGAALDVMSEYMYLYKQLIDEKTLLQVGSDGDQKPRNRTPPSPSAWTTLSKSQQFGFLLDVADKTMPSFKALANKLSEKHHIEFKYDSKTYHNWPASEQRLSKHLSIQTSAEITKNDRVVGPVKGRDRALEKADRDYNADVLRLPDIARCSA